MLMENGWLDRLVEEIDSIKKSGVSMRQFSIDAELGENYVQQLLKLRRPPDSRKLNSLLSVIEARSGKPAILYILTGIRADERGIAFLKMFGSLPEQAQDAALVLLEGQASKST